MNGGQLLSRHDLMQRYGVSAQQVNGWLVRGKHPLPEPSTVISGQQYWRIFILVAWEAGVARARAKKYRNLQVPAAVAPPSR